MPLYNNEAIELQGPNVSILGKKYITIDSERRVIIIQDSGGLLGQRLHHEVIFESATFLPFYEESRPVVEFKCTDGFKGKFAYSRIDTNLAHIFKEHSCLKYIKDTINVGVALYKVDFYKFRNEKVINIGNLFERTIIVFKDQTIQLIPVRDTILNRDESIEINLLNIKSNSYHQETRSTAISCSFLFKNQIITCISIQDMFEDWVLKRFSEIGKNFTSNKEFETSSIFNLTGLWDNTSYENALFDLSFSSTAQVVLRSLDQTTTKLIIDLRDCLLIDKIDNVLLFYSINKGIIAAKSDASAIIKIVQSSLYLSSKLFIQTCKVATLNQFLVLEVASNNSICPKPQRLLLDERQAILFGYGDTIICKFDYSSCLELHDNCVFVSIHMMKEHNSSRFCCSTLSAPAIELYFLKNNLRYQTKIFGYEYRFMRESEARLKLEKIAVASKSIKDYYEKIQERLVVPDQIGKTVMASKNQFPRLWRIVERGSKLLDIPPPEVYIYESFYYNIDTEGMNSPRIEISAKVLEDFSESELAFLIGSNLVHIALNHLETEVLMEGMLKLIPQAKDTPFLGTVLKMIPVPLQAAANMYVRYHFSTWARLTILTGDRFGIAFCGSLESSISAILKLILNSPRLVKELNLSDYLQQTERLNAFLGIASFYTKSDETTPYGMERIIELIRFSHSSQCVLLKKKIQAMEKNK